MYDSLLVRHCNYSSILYRLRVIATYCLLLVKLEWLGYRMVKKLWRYVELFSSDAGTLRTDRFAISISRVSMLTCDNYSNHATCYVFLVIVIILNLTKAVAEQTRTHGHSFNIDMSISYERQGDASHSIHAIIIIWHILLMVHKNTTFYNAPLM